MILVRVVKAAGYSLLAVLLLASCAGAFWEETGWPGPLVEGNRRPSTVQSCDKASLAIADTKYCEHAFVNFAGQRLRTDADVIDVIDAYLPNIPSLAGWAGPERGKLRWSPQYQYVGFPYRLYILTVSPIVVMGVPVEKAPRAAFCGGSLRDGCLRSRKLDEPIRFLAAPEVQPESFWFSPDLKTSEMRIPNDERHVVIPLGSSKLDLTSDGKSWEVRRNSQ